MATHHISHHSCSLTIALQGLYRIHTTRWAAAQTWNVNGKQEVRTILHAMILLNAQPSRKASAFHQN